MMIGVSGASGHLGQAALAELARRGPDHRHVAITRTPSGHESIEARVGDYTDRSSLDVAYQGLDAIMLIPAAGGRAEHFRNAIDAAIAAEVGHIVMISSTGTRKISEPSMFAAYWEGEQHLIRHARNWTILRMNYYSESFAQAAPMAAQSGALASIGEGKVAFVSRDDVAAAAAGILLGQGHFGAIYNASGPTSFSGPERASALAAATGRRIEFYSMSEEQLRAQVAGILPAHYVQPLIDVENKSADGGYDVISGDVARLAGRPPKSLEEVLVQTLPRNS